MTDQTISHTASPPKRLALFSYSFLALPLAFAGLPLYIHAPDFYTRELGMNIGLIGVILLVIRLFDAVQDPVIGYYSDKFAARRASIVTLGIGTLILGMAGVFLGPQAGIATPLWFAGAMILATTGFSIATINLNMIGGFWHDDPRQRTRISAWREAFALTGLLLASITPAILQNFKPAEEAFKIFVLIFGGVMVAAFYMFTRFMRRISAGHMITQKTDAKGLSLLPLLFGHDRAFFAVCFLTHLAAAMPGVLVLFFINDYLGAEAYTGLFLSLYFISGAALMPLWVRMARVIGKYKAWMVSMVLAVVTFVWAFMLQPGDLIAYGIICVLSGTALGADLALPPSILADRVNHNRDEKRATQYYALIAFIPKLAIAIASGLAFILLDNLGFVAGDKNTQEALSGLLLLYALIPCFIKLSATYLLWRVTKREGLNNETDERTAPHGTTHIS